MPKERIVLEYEAGEKVETVHGEKCEVVKMNDSKTQVLLKGSADQPCWFPLSKIKGAVKDKE